MTDHYIPGSNLGITANDDYLLDLWVNLPAGKSIGTISITTNTDASGDKYIDVEMPVVSDASKSNQWIFNTEEDLTVDNDTVYYLVRVTEGTTLKGSGKGLISDATSR